MKKKTLIGLTTGCLMLGFVASSNAGIIIDGTTSGYYNNSLGTILDFTNPYNGTYFFPGANSNPNDPIIDPFPYEPDLSAASAFLGEWLTDPTNLNTYWSGLQSIPQTWTVNTETAIIYAFDAGPTGLENVVASFGVDNGIFVYLNGAFLGGHTRPGGAVLGEVKLNIGYLASGMNYLQVLRADHGGATNYLVEVTGNAAPIPEPATMLLFGTGLAGLAAVSRRRKS